MTVGDWQIDLQTAAGGAVVTDTEFKEATITWVLDGPGSAEVNLPEDSTGSDWLAGQRRVKIFRNSTAYFTGWLTNVSEKSQGRPHITALRCAAHGLAEILDWRVVHGDFAGTNEVATTTAWNLIAHAQAQTDGNHGFTLGTITGTATSRTSRFCDGDVIGDRIRELAEKGTGGFDWEIDPAGAFNAWVGGRGTNKSGTITLTKDSTIRWDVNAETTDVTTYVTVIGEDPDGLCGPPWVTQSQVISGFPRREVVEEADSGNTSLMTDQALEELAARKRARVRVTATFDQDGLPWTWGTSGVWLGDVINVAMDTRFGGTQQMRCIEVQASLERGMTEWTTYTFEVAS